MTRFFILILAGTFLTSLWASGAPLAVGAKAPDVTGVDQNGQTVDFGKIYKEGLVLVYFYPKAGTPGCTAEACSLRDAFSTLTDRGIHVVGVSADTVKSQIKFTDKYKLPFTLIADPEHKIIGAFGVPVHFRMASRQSFLIKDGVVVWRDLKASTEKQAEDVLAAAKTLAGNN